MINHASLISSNHFTCQRDDLHEVFVSQFAGDGSEDAGAARVVFLVDDDCRVAGEPHVAAVRADGRLPGPHDHAPDDLALLHFAGGDRLLDGADDDITNAGDAPLEAALAAAAAQHLDAHRLFGAGVVGDVYSGLLLDHGPWSVVSCPLSVAASHCQY